MNSFRRILRAGLSVSHQWLGIIGGIFFTVLALTGGIVTFRPQIASVLSPSAPTTSCVSTIDWTRAEREVEEFAHAKINRIYAPTAPDTRYRFRMMTERDSIYTHVIYDACSAKVIGTANLGWMDWLVDFHHNLRAENTGRRIAGWFGVILLLSSCSGLVIWLLSRPNLRRLLRVRAGLLMSRDLHSSLGVYATLLLFIASFTGSWLCFPQTMRAALSFVASLPEETRPPKATKPPEGTNKAGLGEILAAAQQAIPDGVIREVRLPEGYGNVQVRMWRTGDFRSLGNNVVTIDRVKGTPIATDLYTNRPPANRFVQAMAGLHYGEWGGLLVRILYGVAGLVSAALFVTGLLMWWLPKRRASLAKIKSSVRPVEAGVPGNIS